MKNDRTEKDGGSMNGKRETALVAGGAGFIGSHLCRTLLDQGHEVICLDNLQTSREVNLRLLEGHRAFTFVRGDIVDPLPDAVTRRRSEERRVGKECVRTFRYRWVAVH